MTELIKVSNLSKSFFHRTGFFTKTETKAVNGVNFSIKKGKTLGLVGESGCGKSTLGRLLLRLKKPTSGEVLFESTNIAELNKSEFNAFKQKAQIIFQDPSGSLDPRMTIKEIIAEPLNTHTYSGNKDQRINTLLDYVGLKSHMLERYSHELSGGQKQRVGIARALALSPQFIVADEPVSALDVSVQAQVLNLIVQLQKELGISFLFIAHDLAIVQHVSHEVAVMYLGSIVEHTDVETFYQNPKHPYTQALLSAIPSTSFHSPKKPELGLKDVLSIEAPPQGCSFYPRCPYAKGICKEKAPALKNIGTENKPHTVSCHLL